MAIDVKVPSLGESITSGILASWHVADGDTVRKEQHLYDLETDKITTEGYAEADGIISLKVDEGEEVGIGQVLAVIDTSQTVDHNSNAKTSSDVKPTSKITGSDEPKPIEPLSKEPTTSPPSEEGSITAAHADQETQNPKTLPTQAPSVQRLAAETGIDPTTLQGSGKGGRVTKGDMLLANEKKITSTEVNSQKAACKPSSEDERTTRIPMPPIRKRIAQRLMEAQHNAAILTTFNEVDMSTVMGLRKQHQERFKEKYGIKLGFMSFFVKAVVYALQEVPQINAQIDGDFIVQNHFFDIGVAMSAPQGLMVPVLRGCDQLNFAEIEQSIADYGEKAKNNKITIDDLQGGVFTISNGGIFGSMLSTPLLNTPQSGILGMHAIQERAVVRKGEIVVRPMMNLALSYDHRLIDGREAVTFLVKVKEAIEEPTSLLLF